MVNVVLGEFERLWNATDAKSYVEFIDDYRKKYEEKKLFNKMVAEQKRIAKSEAVPSMEAYKLQPNSMQRAFIYNLLELRNKGIDKALLISATGERDIFMTDARNLGNIRVSAA